MSELNEETVKQLCRLSRLEISEEEVAILSRSLKQIITYFDELNKIDVSDLSPKSHVESQEIGSLREDEVVETLPREKFLANAPAHVGGMIRVPQVIKSNV